MGRMIEIKLLRRVRFPDKYSITSRVPDKNLGFLKKKKKSNKKTKDSDADDKMLAKSHQNIM